jgi:hypothetical protein
MGRKVGQGEAMSCRANSWEEKKRKKEKKREKKRKKEKKREEKKEKREEKREGKKGKEKKKDIFLKKVRDQSYRKLRYKCQEMGV